MLAYVGKRRKVLPTGMLLTTAAASLADATDTTIGEVI
jgi:hypothetical protein